MSEAKRICSGKVYDSFHVRSYPCGRNGKLLEDGAYWCGIHAPSVVKRRKQKCDEKYNRARSIDQAGYTVVEAQRELVSAVFQAQPFDLPDSVIAARTKLEDAKARLAELRSTPNV